MSRRLAAVAVAAALVACAGTLLGASDRAFKITAPADGATVRGRVTVHLLAKGFDDIAYVVFGVDQVRPHSSNSLPYRYVLNTQALGNGAHTLTAWGFSKYGMVASANPVTIVVANPSASTPPVTAEPEPAGLGPMLFTPPAPATAPSEPQGGEPSQLAESSIAAPEGEVASPAEASEPTEAPEPAAAAIPATVETSAAETAPAADTAAIAIAPAACPAAAKAEIPCEGVIPAERPEQVTINVDGEALHGDVEAELREGIAYGPLRAIVERIGGQIGWEHLTKQATAEADDVRMVVLIGQSTARVNDEQVSLAGPVWLKQGRTMAPVRSCGEALRLGVTWQPTLMTVALMSPAHPEQIGMAVK